MGSGKIFLAAVSLATTTCSPAESKSAKIRFQVDIEIQDHDIIRRGSGIWSLSLSKASLPITTQYNSKFLAEAIPISLSSDRWIFILPINVASNVSGANWVKPAFINKEISNTYDRFSLYEEISHQIGRSHSFTCKNIQGKRTFSGHDHLYCPTILYSNQIRKPESFNNIDSSDDIFVRSVTLTITDKDNDRKLNEMMPWLTRAQDLYSSDIRAFYNYMSALPKEIQLIRMPFINESSK